MRGFAMKYRASPTLACTSERKAFSRVELGQARQSKMFLQDKRIGPARECPGTVASHLGDAPIYLDVHRRLFHACDPRHVDNLPAEWTTVRFRH